MQANGGIPRGLKGFKICIPHSDSMNEASISICRTCPLFKEVRRWLFLGYNYDMFLYRNYVVVTTTCFLYFSFFSHTRCSRRVVIATTNVRTIQFYENRILQLLTIDSLSFLFRSHTGQLANAAIFFSPENSSRILHRSVPRLNRRTIDIFSHQGQVILLLI